MKSSDSGVGLSSESAASVALGIPPPETAGVSLHADQSGLPGPHVLAQEMLTADRPSLDGTMFLEVSHMVQLGS